MTKRTFRAFLAMGALATAAASWGCVADRPSRNGVFNENQYLRKAFIIRNGDGSTEDTGWMMKATIVSASQPNPLANAGLFVGSENGGQLVRFEVTQDHLNLINMREIDDNSNAAQGARVPEVVNSWPITNVDLKYQINLDGEKTNFYQENQELDWQVRQWVKLNFAKNDLSDVAPFGSYEQSFLAKCTDLGNSSTTLVPDSFQVDEANDYMQWTVQITVPVNYDDQTCLQQYGGYGNGTDMFLVGHQNVTFNLMYSFARAVAPDKITYQQLEVDEKDPIQHKYGPFIYRTTARDNNSGLLASRGLAVRFDPNKNIVWYFAPGYPEQYKDVFLKHGGIVDQTNTILATAGAKARLVVLNNDDLNTFNDHAGPNRQYGDVRYSFIRFESDLDTGSPFLGVTQFVLDPRTGEEISASINIAGASYRASAIEYVDSYLQSVGASLGVDSAGEWPDGPANCKDGDTMPIIPDCQPGAGVTAQCAKNQSSTLYYEMQKALNQPAEQYGPKGPADFVAQQDDDFRRAYYALLPYLVFQDPAANPYVLPEGQGGVYGAPTSASAMQTAYANEAQFQQMMSSIDHGIDPYDGVTGQQGLANATQFANTMRDLTINHRNLDYAKAYLNLQQGRMFDEPNMVSLLGVTGKDARQCVTGADGTTHWQTKEEWIQGFIDSYWALVVWHEFGHSLGLEHNYMASVDEPNFPHYKDRAGRDHIGMYTSSVMDYNYTEDRVFWYNGNDDQGNPTEGWGPYDRAAIAWIYANNAQNAVPTDSSGAPLQAQGISGQVSATAPWNDPYGFTADGKEIQYLRCDDYQTRYTPLCRQFDLGTTPSEIVANELDLYEAHYKYRNFRTYRKYWNDSGYGSDAVNLILDMRRFVSLWAFDWSTAELTDTLRRIGITNPDPNGSAQNYYDQLTNKFVKEASAANSMIAAFHQAVIQQSSGERPYKTIYDKFYGDVTQQGIILDKYFAMSGWVGLWPTDNYDQNQAGFYIASYAGLGEPFYDDVAQLAVNNMVGGGYDVYPWFVPTAVALFAQDSHRPEFSGRIDVRDWIGGKTFSREQDFLDYFRRIAVDNNYVPWQTEGDTNVAVAANGASVTIQVPNTESISVGEQVVVDSGDNTEETMVLAKSPTTITVELTKAHAAPFSITAEPCTDISTCDYDPRVIAPTQGQTPGEFHAPDKKTWIWAYIPDRNQYIACEKERNTATYIIVHNYNLDIMSSQDDGSYPGNAYGLQLPMKYTLDSFTMYN